MIRKGFRHLSHMIPIYMPSETGKAVVLEASPDWTVLQTNDLGEEVYATPAVGSDCLYVRTASMLYCFSD